MLDSFQNEETVHIPIFAIAGAAKTCPAIQITCKIR